MMSVWVMRWWENVKCSHYFVLAVTNRGSYNVLLSSLTNDLVLLLLLIVFSFLVGELDTGIKSNFSRHTSHKSSEQFCIEFCWNYSDGDSKFNGWIPLELLCDSDDNFPYFFKKLTVCLLYVTFFYQSFWQGLFSVEQQSYPKVPIFICYSCFQRVKVGLNRTNEILSNEYG